MIGRSAAEIMEFSCMTNRFSGPVNLPNLARNAKSTKLSVISALPHARDVAPGPAWAVSGAPLLATRLLARCSGVKSAKHCRKAAAINAAAGASKNVDRKNFTGLAFEMHLFCVKTFCLRLFRASWPVLALAASVGLVAGAASAQSPPSDSALRDLVASGLPDYLRIQQLDLGPASASSTGGNKRLIYRFDASLAASEDLYSEVRQVGAFVVVVVPTLARNDQLRADGVLDLTFGGGDWTKGVSFGQGFEKYGLPIDRFGGPAIVAGDPDGEAKLALIQAQVEADKLAVVQQEIATKVAAERAKGQAQLRAERARAAADLLQVIAENATKRGQLIAKQRQEIAQLETGMDILRQRLTRQIGQAEDLKKMQLRLRAPLADISSNERQAIDDFNRMREERQRVLDKLPKKWVGVVRCSDNANPSNSTRATLEITVEDTNSSGFSVSYVVNDRRPPSFSVKLGAASILNKTIDFPLRVEFSAPKLASGDRDIAVPDGFSLEMTSTGKLVGSVPMWSYAWNVPSTCTFNLSG